jgi:type IV pilus assembly protein PilY1
MKTKNIFVVLAVLLGALASGQGLAQTIYSEDFTSAATTNSWYFFNGACLTAGTSSSTASPGTVPGCATIWSNYYKSRNDSDPYLVGGNSGYLGTSTAPSSGSSQIPDPLGYGALRFTNGYPYGHQERGAIVSGNTFNTGSGIQVTFKTVTYRGDSGGAGGDGADGISFFLMNGSVTPAAIGATGGSLGYSCTNESGNVPYDGLTGGYIGLGIDEYGNFLNGTNLASGYVGTNSATGDNAAFGYGYKPDRIGIRGAGNISWTALTAAYGTYQGSGLPYYPASLTTIISGSTTLAQAAVRQACSTGNLYNYYNPAAPVSVTTATLTTSAGATNTANPAGILDYAPIPNAYKELTAFTIAKESATTRSQATPILYNLKVTQNGLLSLSYSTGGAYSYIIQNQSITTANGALPSTLRFGFAGSTGGDTNIHEIMCFKAASATTSGSSATVNEKQAAKVEAGTQAYFAFYNPNDWTGTITANNLVDTAGVISVNTTANWDAQCLLTGTPAAGCASTGVAGATTATPVPTSRVMITWDTTNHNGIPFEWTSLNANQQTVLDDENGTPDSTATNQYRLNYLRGDRSNEITAAGAGLYRARDGVLGDIVDSSPAWVGPPTSPYTLTWTDRLYSTAMSENTGTQSYLQYVTAEQGRLNVVYAGSNDGFLHGFESGSFDPLGNFCGTTNSTITCSATPNDGKEVLAYMPGSTLYSPALASTTGGCAGTNINTGTVVQNIHGWTPAIGASPPAVSCETPELDYSAAPYGHNFFVDSTPGTGDLYYNNAWHTWLVGGLGSGGAAIYALDVTNPSAFSESASSNVLIGEWNASTITCTNVTGCGTNLGNTYGTPQIRRLHNGSWAAIFGNGFGSASGDAGIYVMLINNAGAATYGTTTFYYLSTNPTGTASNAIFSGTASQAAGVVTVSSVSTGAIAVGDVLTGAAGKGAVPGSKVISFGTGTGGAGTYNVSTSGTVSSGAVTVGNGIAYTTPADLDGDHITDYVYAGDLQGNVWRFDLTSNTPSQWGVTNPGGASINKPTGAAPGQGGGGAPGALFTAKSSSGQIQRITTQLLVVSNLVAGSGQYLLIEFGTGQRTQLTNAAPESYMTGTQSLYGVWDWNLSTWNALSPGNQYASVAASVTGVASPYTLGYANLTAQTFTSGTMGTVNGTNATVCWAGTTTCGTGNTSFGWYANLPGSSEQIIFNPVFFQGAILVNSTVPAVNSLTSCTIAVDTGYTYALSVTNGGTFTNAFPSYTYTNQSTNVTTVVSDATAAGVQTNATGSVYIVNTNEGKANIVYQTVSGTPGAQQVNIPTNVKAKRLTWTERR